jgi:hypothetical protein
MREAASSDRKRHCVVAVKAHRQKEKAMAHQLDELAKALAEGVSRGKALRRVGSVLAGSLLACSLLAATGLREVLLFNRHGVPR